jgi:hypothetical protein
MGTELGAKREEKREVTREELIWSCLLPLGFGLGQAREQEVNLRA